MKQTMLQDFIRFAQKEYGVSITAEKTLTPDSFEKIFKSKIEELEQVQSDKNNKK